MRILIIWGESLAKPGGGTVHCLGLGGGLQACGHQVTVITPRYGKTTLRTGDLDVRAVRLPPRSLPSFLCFQLLSILCLPRWLWRHRPEAVYVRTCFFQAVMALICRAAGVPLVGEVDSMVDVEIVSRRQPRWWGGIVRGLERVNLRLAAGLVCVTPGLRAESVRRGANADTTVVIPNGARTDVMRPADRLAARARLGLPEEAVIAAFAGSFAPWAGLDLLVEAARLLARRNPNIRIALMGDGMMAPQVRAWAEEDALANVLILLPEAPREQVADFLNACDFVVLPFNDTSILRFGLSSLKFWDAVSLGLPILVPRMAGLGGVLSELGLPGEFSHGSAESLADAMEALAAAGPRSLQQRRRVHEIVLRRYSWTAVGREVADHLRRLTGRGGRNE